MMEELSQNGFFNRQPHLNFQPPPANEMRKSYEEGDISSGAKFCTNPLAAARASIGPLSLMTDEELIQFEQKNGRDIDPDTVDIKKLKRTIANRLSAQKSRLKKSHLVEEMEKKVRELEENINAIKFQLERSKLARETSHMQNIMMKQRLDYLSTKSNLTNKDIEKNKAEAMWLREFFQIMKQNALNTGKEKIQSLSVDQREELLPELQIHQAFNINPNGDPQNVGDTGGYGEISNQFMNMEAFINYQ